MDSGNSIHEATELTSFQEESVETSEADTGDEDAAEAEIKAEAELKAEVVLKGEAEIETEASARPAHLASHSRSKVHSVRPAHLASPSRSKVDSARPAHLASPSRSKVHSARPAHLASPSRSKVHSARPAHLTSPSWSKVHSARPAHLENSQDTMDKVQAFVESGKPEDFEGCTREQLKQIAERFGIRVKASKVAGMKDEILRQLRAKSKEAEQGAKKEAESGKKDDGQDEVRSQGSSKSSRR
ncbi:neurofilament heavy polypeptide-like [Procambarus clarkii]|uniref:neurofilament heavy polypeptide-like n=1 Tax=Procambarus clarkii TaxID=6728 RepID=UPI003742EB7D